MSEIQHNTAQSGAAPDRYDVRKTVVMVGMMGAGKTAVGRALAQKLAIPFLDSDAEIESAANLTVPEIFDRDGEMFFRKRETEVITRLLIGAPCVLSTGGGAFLAEGNRALISQRGISVWLDADVGLLWNRVKHKDTRPLLRTANPRATLEQLFTEREPIYAQADMAVKCDAALSIDAMADRVIRALLDRPDVVEKSDD